MIRGLGSRCDISSVITCRPFFSGIRRSSKAQALCPFGLITVSKGNKYLDWKRMIDHIGVVVLVMLIGLHAAFGVFGTGQQGVLSRLLRCKPLKFPASPRMPLNRGSEFFLGPGLATVSALRDLGYLRLARPCSAGNRVYLVRFKRFINSWSSDLGLQLHFSQCAPHGLSIQIIPITVV